jgi:membrane-associated protein
VSVYHSVLNQLLGASGPVAFVVIGLLVFGEAAIFLGFVLPGETAVVLGGVLASRGQISLGWLMVVVVLSAVIGDSVGYEVGRRYGHTVLRWRRIDAHRAKVHEAQEFLRQRGAFAVFLGRWTFFLRAMTPGLAGVSRIPYPKFLIWNALGGLVWGITFCLVGFLAGNSYGVIEKTVGRIGGVITVVLVVALFYLWHRHQKAARPEIPDSLDDEPQPPTASSPA